LFVDLTSRDEFMSIEGLVSTVLSPIEAANLVKNELWKGWTQERDRLDRIDHWYRWTHEEIHLPRSATMELKRLTQLSKVPWLGLVVTAAAQAMYVDGYRSKLDQAEQISESSPPWSVWQANGMDRRQVAIHRAALAYGYTFMTVLPGVDPMTGEAMAVMRGASPRKMFAIWDDPAEDDWPQYALKIVDKQNDEILARLYDSTGVYSLRIGSDGDTVVLDEPKIHDAGVCPVVRFANMLDLDGRTPGEVEPYIAIAARINKTSFDRMLVQHFNSWKVRYVTGMAEPDTEEDAIRKKLELRINDILVAEDPDTKFGTLDGTELGGFINAHQADVESLAAASQTPTHELTGQMANLSAEALAAARASLNQKVTERQKSFGASHAQALRLACAYNGDDDYARDVTGRVTWQDMEIRSMSQAADALGKMVQMLGVPPTATWGRIPGVERSDVQEWVKLAEAGDPITKLQERLAAQAATNTAAARGATVQGTDATADVDMQKPQPVSGGGQNNARNNGQAR
jgi:hypothetical protein